MYATDQEIGNEEVSSQSPNPNAKLWAGVLLTVVMVAAYLYMKAQHMEETGLVALMSPLVTYLLLGHKVEAEAQKQNETINKIDKQTNGVLDKRIRDGVRAALKEYDENGAKNL